MRSLSKINFGLRFANVVGFVLALYAFIVETSKEHDPSYTAMCDINEHMSCSKVFTSNPNFTVSWGLGWQILEAAYFQLVFYFKLMFKKYGRGFGLLHYLVGEDSALNQPNSVGGMIFFIGFFLLSFRDTLTVSTLLLRLSIGSVVCCIYLAYILYFVLHDFCIVCISTYVVNAVNLTLCCAKLKLLRDDVGKARAKQD